MAKRLIPAINTITGLRGIIPEFLFNHPEHGKFWRAEDEDSVAPEPIEPAEVAEPDPELPEQEDTVPSTNEDE